MTDYSKATLPLFDEPDVRFLLKLRESLEERESWQPNQYHASDIAFLNRLIITAVNAHDALAAEVDEWKTAYGEIEALLKQEATLVDQTRAECGRLRQALEEAQKAIRAVHEWIGALPLTPTFDMKWEAQKSLEAAENVIRSTK